MKPNWVTQVSQFAKQLPEPFVQQYQYLVDNLTGLLSNGLTFKDNMLSSVVTGVTFVHGIEKIVNNPFKRGLRPIGAFGVNVALDTKTLAVDNVKIRSIGTDLKYLGITVHYKPPYGYIELLRDATQALADGVLTAVQYDQEVYVLGGMTHSLTVNPSRITFAYDGVIEVNSMVEFDANIVGRRGIRIGVSDGRRYGKFSVNAASSASSNLTPSAFFRVFAGQYIESFVVQNSGGVLNILGTGTDQTKVQARYIAPLPTYEDEPYIIIMGG